MNPLSTKKRSELRAEAHALSPVVIIGDKGLTDEVLAEIDRSLKAHELIKVRASTAERADRDAWLATICERLAAHAVQQIGKMFVIFRENPKEREQGTDVRHQKKSAMDTRSRKTSSDVRSLSPVPSSTRTSRPGSPAPSPRPASGPPRRRPRTSR